MLFPQQTSAQFHYDARTIGMGGTGVASAVGVAAVRHNPANIMIYERPQRWNLTFGQVGYLYSGGIRSDDLADVHRYLYAFDSSMPLQEFNYATSRSTLLQDRYSDGNRDYSSLHTLDALVFALSFTGKNSSFALSHFIRGENQYTVGRGWYNPEGLSIDNLLITDRRFSQQYNLRHEIGFTMASENQLISGWLSDLSKIYVGFSARLILPLSYADLELRSVYATGESSQTLTHQGQFTSVSAGAVTDILEGKSGLNPADLSNISGIGGGFDLGVTYIIGFGGDVSLTGGKPIPTRNSIRISASLTDIGFISYNKNLGAQNTDEQTRVLARSALPGEAKSFEYSGNPVDFRRFTDGILENGIIEQATSTPTDVYRVLMPARANAGIAFQVSRLTVGAEVQRPLKSLTDHPAQTTAHVGGELRLLKTIPLRAGMSFERDTPVRYHAGAGLDFRVFTLSAAVVVRSPELTGQLRAEMVAVTGLQVRF